MRTEDEREERTGEDELKERKACGWLTEDLKNEVCFTDNLRLRATKNSVFLVVVRRRSLPLASAQDPNPRAAGSMAAVAIADAKRQAI